MAGSLRQILLVALRWGGAWAIIGLAAGIEMMFNRSELIAESGAKPHDLGSYAFWIPAMLVVGLVFGLLLGLVFASLMMLMSRLQKASEAKTSFLATHGTRLACGAVAGGVIGWPLLRDSGALIFVGLGLCSAAVSLVMSRRGPKNGRSGKGRVMSPSG